MAQMDGEELTVNFSGGAYDELKKLADAQNLDMSEALRRAIALNKWVIETQKDAKILVERKGKIREIVSL
ncbi:MAG TPA: hypothetical protein VGT44_13915 [Ktedonobacteraceae bacterium]|nr:hypothetical protein [Ktedonobacteraceae bacterium]